MIEKYNLYMSRICAFVELSALHETMWHDIRTGIYCEEQYMRGYNYFI